MAVLYALVLAVLNIAAGVALAIYAGRRYELMMTAQEITPPASMGGHDDDDLTAVSASSPTALGEPEDTPVPSEPHIDMFDEDEDDDLPLDHDDDVPSPGVDESTSDEAWETPEEEPQEPRDDATHDHDTLDDATLATTDPAAPIDEAQQLAVNSPDEKQREMVLSEDELELFVAAPRTRRPISTLQEEDTEDPASVSAVEPDDEPSDPTSADAEGIKTERSDPDASPDVSPRPDEPAEPLPSDDVPDVANDTAPLDSRGVRQPVSINLTEATPRDLRPARVVLEHFARNVVEFHEKAAGEDVAIRQRLRDGDLSAAVEHVAALQSACESHATAGLRVAQTFQTLQAELPELVTLSRPVLNALDRLSARLKVTIETLARLDRERDQRKAIERILGIIAKMLAANHHLLDTTDIALGLMASDDDFLRALDPARHHDPVTQILNRVGLRVFYRQYITDPQTADKPLGMSLIDVDDLTKINEQYGQSVGDRLLKAIAQLIDTRKHRRAVFGRIAGPQFAVLYPGVDNPVTITETDRLRQTVEAAEFRLDGKVLKATVTALVLDEHDASATPKDLLDRAVEFLMQGKRQNRNRTYLTKEETCSPVTPPRYQIDPLQLEI